MIWVMAMSRSPEGSEPKPAQGHSASFNIWTSYISKKGPQAEGDVHSLSHVFQDDLILYQHQQPCEDSHIRSTEQAGNHRETWACTMCGSQWSTGRRSTGWICSPASSVLPSSGQGRNWTCTIERSMLGKGHFALACVEMHSTPSRTCHFKWIGSTGA